VAAAKRLTSITVTEGSNLMAIDTGTRTGTIGMFEMVLQVADLGASERFYREVVGLTVANRWDPARNDGREGLFLDLGGGAFLGLWPEASGGAKAIAGAYGGSHVHFALLVEYGTLDARRAQIESLGVPIETEREFGPGDRAIYINDPDGNVVELTERVTDWAGRPYA